MSEAAGVCCAEKCQPVNALPPHTANLAALTAKATPLPVPADFELKYDSFRGWRKPPKLLREATM